MVSLSLIIASVSTGIEGAGSLAGWRWTFIIVNPNARTLIAIGILRDRPLPVLSAYIAYCL